MSQDAAAFEPAGGSPGPGTSAPLGPPPVLAGYRVEALVGVGGTGEVWRARDVLTGRLVALKRLRHDGPPAERDRLRREAAVLAGISSSHIVRLVTVVTAADGLVLVLEFQGGGSLASLLRTRPSLTPGEVVTIAAPLAAALVEVHALGLVHGDISPANVLFSTDGRPVLSDLGITRLVGRAGAAVTVEYADPAVLEGAPFTRSSDVYALGAVCYTALVGSPPPPGDLPSLAGTAPGLPGPLIEVIDAALSRDAGHRPDAASFSARLLEACAAQPVRLAGASVPVTAPPTAAVRRLPPAPVPDPPQPSRGERLMAAAARARLSPRRLVAAAAVPIAVGGAVWGGVAWAHSTSAGAPASPAAAGAAASAGRGQGGARSAPLPTAPLARPTGDADAGMDSPAVAPAPTSTRASLAARPAGATATAPHESSPSRSSAATAAARSSSGPTSTAGQLVGSSSERARLTAVLRRLDALRDSAFVTGSTSALDAVYARGSSPWVADRRAVGALLAAGRHASGLRLDVRSATVLSVTSTSARLRVTDELAPYLLLDGGGHEVAQQPGRGLRTWVISLTNGPAGWRISAILRA